MLLLLLVNGVCCCCRCCRSCCGGNSCTEENNKCRHCQHGDKNRETVTSTTTFSTTNKNITSTHNSNIRLARYNTSAMNNKT